MKTGTLYVNAHGRLCRQRGMEWPAVFLTGILKEASMQEYILMGLEGWAMRRIFPAETPALFGPAMRLTADALRIQNPEPGTMKRLAIAHGSKWEGPL